MNTKDNFILKNVNKNYPKEINDYICEHTTDLIEVSVTNIIPKKAEWDLVPGIDLKEGEKRIYHQKGNDGGTYFISSFFVNEDERHFLKHEIIKIKAENGLIACNGAFDLDY